MENIVREDWLNEIGQIDHDRFKAFVKNASETEPERTQLLTDAQRMMEFAASEVGEESLESMRSIHDREILNELKIHFAEIIWDPIMGFDQPEIVACAPEFSQLKQEIQAVVEQFGAGGEQSLEDAAILDGCSRAIEIIDYALKEYLGYDGALPSPGALEALKVGFKKVSEALNTIRQEGAVGFNQCSVSEAVSQLNEESYVAGLTRKEFPHDTDFKLKVMDEYFKSDLRVKALTAYKNGLEAARKDALMYSTDDVHQKLNRMISNAQSKINEMTTGKVEAVKESAERIDLDRLHFWTQEMAAIEDQRRRPLSGSEFKQVVASIEDHARGAQIYKAEAVDAAGRLAALHGNGGELLFRDPALRNGYVAGLNGRQSVQQDIEPAAVAPSVESAPQYEGKSIRMRQ